MATIIWTLEKRGIDTYHLASGSQSVLLIRTGKMSQDAFNERAQKILDALNETTKVYDEPVKT